MAIRIYCINKDNGNHENPLTAISYLGWQNPANNEKGKTSRVDMYNWIKKGGVAYVVDPKDNSKVTLTTAETPRGTQYVKTRPNDTGRDNLLTLPECQ